MIQISKTVVKFTDFLLFAPVLFPVAVFSNSSVKIRWLRLDSAFMLVARVSRWPVAPAMHALSSSTVCTGQETRPSTYTPVKWENR